MACQHCTEKKDWTRFGLNSRCPHAVVNGPRSPCVLHARAWTRVILNLARCAVTKVENPQATAQAPKGRASVCAALHHRNWCTCACELGTGRIRVETSRKQKHPLFLPPPTETSVVATFTATTTNLHHAEAAFIFANVKVQVMESRAVANINAVKARNKVVKAHPEGTIVCIPLLVSASLGHVWVSIEPSKKIVGSVANGEEE